MDTKVRPVRWSWHEQTRFFYVDRSQKVLSDRSQKVLSLDIHLDRPFFSTIPHPVLQKLADSFGLAPGWKRVLAAIHLDESKTVLKVRYVDEQVFQPQEK
jgi:hypothetical protein